jgi:hypothetical protein
MGKPVETYTSMVHNNIPWQVQWRGDPALTWWMFLVIRESEAVLWKCSQALPGVSCMLWIATLWPRRSGMWLSSSTPSYQTRLYTKKVNLIFILFFLVLPAYPPSGCVLQQAGWRIGQDCSGYQDHLGEGERLSCQVSGYDILCLKGEGHQQQPVGGPRGADQHWGLPWQGGEELSSAPNYSI